MEVEKNKGGRPKKERPHNYTLAVQVSQEERVTIAYIASCLNCSMSEVVRKLINTSILYSSIDNIPDMSKIEFVDKKGKNHFELIKAMWLIDSE